jgi:hypothetical protein
MQVTEQKDTENASSENTFEVAVDNSNAIQIRTSKDGHNAGRKYCLQASSAEELADILSELRLLTHRAIKRAATRSKWSKLQERVRRVYNSGWFQGVAAFLIIAVRARSAPSSLGTYIADLDPPPNRAQSLTNPDYVTAAGAQNFVVSVAEAQIEPAKLLLPDGSPTPVKRTLDNLNVAFTIIFTFELLANLFSNWLRPFLANSWSVIDAGIVGMSLIVLGPIDFPVSILRALRVVRLFGRLESSKKILSALSVSIVPMCNAFLINLIVAMICAPLPLLSTK